MSLAVAIDHSAFEQEARRFADDEVAPLAARHDAECVLDRALVRRLGECGYLASFLSPCFGGRGLSYEAYAVLHEQLGRICTSTRSLLTVHDMVAHTISSWGSEQLRETWLPRLASGDALAAFALSEAHQGSDVQAVRTRARRRGDAYVLDGQKQWVSLGQIADLFLVFARTEDGVSAFVVERRTRGLSTKPIGGLLGVRASMLAELRLEGCVVPTGHLLGRAGRAAPQITTSALTLGRLGVASGSVGIVQGCLDASVAYARGRTCGDGVLLDRPLVQRMVARMVTDAEAGRLLCAQAASALDRDDPWAPIGTAIAKYFAAIAASRSSRDAVQIHGAVGCTSRSPVERLLRDAKVMEIIEGSNEIQEMLIGKRGCAPARTVCK